MVGRAALLRRFSTGDEGSTPLPSALAPMVKRRSFLASNEGFRVRVLVGVLGRLSAFEPTAFGGLRGRMSIAERRLMNGVCGVAVCMRRCDRRGSGFDSPRTPCSVRARLRPVYEPGGDGLRRSVLLGEQAVSKAAPQGSNPCAPAFCRRGSTEKGSGPVNRLMLVRIQPSALGYSKIFRWTACQNDPGLQRSILLVSHLNPPPACCLAGKACLSKFRPFIAHPIGIGE